MSDHKSDKEARNMYTKYLSMDKVKEVSKFINKKVKGEENDKCPICGDSRNSVLHTEYAIPVGQNVPLAAGISSHMPAYATACTNCGFLRFFSKILIDQMIFEDNRDSKSEGES